MNFPCSGLLRVGNTQEETEEKMEKFFKLKEHGTNVKTEVLAGVTTFFAMAYIIFVNPVYLSQAGMDFTAVMVATCVSAAIGTLLTAFSRTNASASACVETSSRPLGSALGPTIRL